MSLVNVLVTRFLCVIVCGAFVHAPFTHATSSLARNDPYPQFTTTDPHTFLHTQEKLRIKAPYFAMEKNNSIGFSVAGYGQHADSGRDIHGNRFFPTPLEKLVTSVSSDTATLNECTNTLSCTPEAKGFRIELGDIGGRANMIALMLGEVPDGQVIPPTLQNAINEIGADAEFLDPRQLFGHFSIPLKYRKRGVRFDMLINLIAGFGINMRAGLANICQTVEALHDLTCFATNECPFTPFPDEVGETSQPKFKELQSKVTTHLMNQVCTIAKELGLDIGNFQDSSIDEIRFSLFWRHAYELNAEHEEWPYILATPFFQLTGSFSPVKMQDFNKVFAVPFGNNRHSAVGFDVGLNFDFVETIEIGAQVGITHFFDKEFCGYRVPTHEKQRVFFPFTTDVVISPGHNWHFAVKIAAFHFLDKLSAHFQFVMIEHKPDCICLLHRTGKTTTKNCDSSVFKLKALEGLSGWKSKVANVGFNYDISPNIGLGLLWQAPLSQRNSYRSSTLMLGLYATF